MFVYAYKHLKKYNYQTLIYQTFGLQQQKFVLGLQAPPLGNPVLLHCSSHLNFSFGHAPITTQGPSSVISATATATIKSIN